VIGRRISRRNRPPTEPARAVLTNILDWPTVGGDGQNRGVITVPDVRALALALPRTEEHLIRDQVKFRVGRIVYAAISPDETILGFGFHREERPALLAAEPDRFLLHRASDARYNWIDVRMATIGVDEMREFVIEGWRMCVPKRVAAAHLGR